MHRTLTFGKLLFTTVIQGTGAPIVDWCAGHAVDGRTFEGRAIHLRPWRKDRYGDRLMNRALVIGWFRWNGRRWCWWRRRRCCRRDRGGVRWQRA